MKTYKIGVEPLAKTNRVLQEAQETFYEKNHHHSIFDTDGTYHHFCTSQFASDAGVDWLRNQFDISGEFEKFSFNARLRLQVKCKELNKI